LRGDQELKKEVNKGRAKGTKNVAVHAFWAAAGGLRRGKGALSDLAAGNGGKKDGGWIDTSTSGKHTSRSQLR